MSANATSWPYWPHDPADLLDHDPTGHVDRLLALIDRLRPAWHRRALCRGEPVRAFFPERGDDPQLAYELCGRCPVRELCLDEAIADPRLDFGVRGGLSAAARKARRRNAKPPPAGGHP